MDEKCARFIFMEPLGMVTILTFIATGAIFTIQGGLMNTNNVR